MTGQTIKDYTFSNVLGKGGMATVYLATDKKFQTTVAVKVLNKEFIHNENIRQRFLAEARNMFRMSHPNVIKVTDLIDEGDLVAFVMDFIEGPTLKDYLDTKNSLSDQEIKQLFSQMLAAVGYVHEQGMVHRDIKPSNFIVNKKGVVKLLDFGIAKNTELTAAEYTLTSTTQNMGTPMYMSPEQIKSSKDVEARSDIYSLGVVLWQMVTRRKPYDAQTLSTFDIQSKIVNEPLSFTGTGWDTIIKKATQKNISDRYPDIQSFQRAVKVLDIESDKTQLLQQDADRTIIDKQTSYSGTVGSDTGPCYCSRCGKQNPDNAKFCIGCGSTIVAKQKNMLPTAYPLDNKVNKKKRINWVLTGSMAAFFIAAGLFFIFFNKKKKTDENITTTTTEQVTPLPAIDTPADYVPPQPTVSKPVSLNQDKQGTEATISNAEVDYISQVLKNFYQCENDGDVSCLLSNYNYPVNRYYGLNNVSYDALRNLFIESFNLKLSSHYINIKWDYCTVQKNGTGYKAVLYADYSFTRQNTPDENRSRSIEIIIYLNSGYKITTIYENQQAP